MKIRIAGLVDESIVDGPGFRYTVFVQGCSHNCELCHNKHTHDPNGGDEMDTEDIIKAIKKNPMLDGVTLSGGEPFEQAKECYDIAKKVKELGLNVVTYSGYTFEQLLDMSKNDENIKALIFATDILIDGRYEAEKRSLELCFRGSLNQRIIDVKKSLETGEAMLISYD